MPVVPRHEGVGLARQGTDGAKVDHISGHFRHQHLLDVGSNLEEREKFSQLARIHNNLFSSQFKNGDIS
jgi:hypothetical protein